MTFLRMPRLQPGGTVLLGCLALAAASCMTPSPSHPPVSGSDSRLLDRQGSGARNGAVRDARLTDPVTGRTLTGEEAKRAAREAGAAEGRPSADGSAEDDTSSQSVGLSDVALKAEAHRVVQEWHAAASIADRELYIGSFALDAVVLGPDSNERSDLATYTNYVDEVFRTTKGWTYTPGNRHMHLGPQSQIAWFDEQLASGTYMGLRGTGVLRRVEESWKIVHYSLTYTVSEEVARDVIWAERARDAAPSGPR